MAMTKMLQTACISTMATVALVHAIAFHCNTVIIYHREFIIGWESVELLYNDYSV